MEIQQLREQHELQQKQIEDQRQHNSLLLKRIAAMERQLADQTIGSTTTPKIETPSVFSSNVSAISKAPLSGNGTTGMLELSSGYSSSKKHEKIIDTDLRYSSNEDSDSTSDGYWRYMV